MSKFLALNNLELDDMMFWLLRYTSAGYGYIHPHTPAVYLLKFIEMCGMQSQMHHVEGGMVTLWERLAQQLDIRFRSRVEHVTRTKIIERRAGKPQEIVEIKTSKGEVLEDQIVIACPLKVHIRSQFPNLGAHSCHLSRAVHT
jgi:hypothetical protein